MTKLLIAVATIAVVGFTSNIAEAQPNPAMAAKCRAAVAKALPGGDVSMKVQKQRLFRVCMQNGGKL